jgi:hypothetical protein
MKRILVKLLGVLAVGTALLLQSSPASAQDTGYALLTITNPAPVSGAKCGWSVAAVGADRILVGAPGAANGGAAYLFSTNGASLITFTNPTPAANEWFGNSVAAVGSDQVLIGAPYDDTGATDAGAAYLFNTAGALLTTFTNPAPEESDSFGFSLAAVGTNFILIGAHGDSTGASHAGAVYLFDTYGTWLTTFTNPAPSDYGAFGYSVAALGGDRVLIGAVGDDTGATDAGMGYLFRTNGTMPNFYINPTPVAYDEFGYSVAAWGTHSVLVGAPGDDTGAFDAGAAYLFSTNGTLLITFTNPTPATSDGFGRSVAGVGSDRVLIGALSDDAGAGNSGAAYLFSPNGALLTTFTNPTPAANDKFGWTVAAVGNSQVLIAAPYDDTGANDAGAVYLFNHSEQPSNSPNLTIRPTTTNTVAVLWPSPSTDWTLQENTNGVASVNWSNVTSGIQDDGTNKSFIVNPPTGSRFYRLFKP